MRKEKRRSYATGPFRYEARVRLWLYPGDAAWHFVTFPKALSRRIKAFAGKRPSFGSVRVAATIGETTWKTSLFPSAKDEAFLLPVKASVRKTEKIAAGDMVRVAVELEM
jgi:hypothetical protein